jgi:hypothetical protein
VHLQTFLATFLENLDLQIKDLANLILQKGVSHEGPQSARNSGPKKAKGAPCGCAFFDFYAVKVYHGAWAPGILRA